MHNEEQDHQPNQQFDGVPMTPAERHEKLVADALLTDEGGMALNRVRGRCGGSISMTSMALTSLEARGHARFDGGLWYRVPVLVQPERSFVAGKIAAASRVRDQQRDARHADPASERPDTISAQAQPVSPSPTTGTGGL